MVKWTSWNFGDFHSFIDFYIKNASEVDEINIQIRNRTELNLMGYESKVYRIEKFRVRPSLKNVLLANDKIYGKSLCSVIFSNWDLVHIDCNTLYFSPIPSANNEQNDQFPEFYDEYLNRSFSRLSRTATETAQKRSFLPYTLQLFITTANNVFHKIIYRQKFSQHFFNKNLCSVSSSV